MEKIFALHGRFNGTARVCAEDGHTALRLSADQSLPAGCTAYLLCGGKLWALPVNGAAGSVQGELSPEALLVAAGEKILCSGGFAGKRKEQEKYELELRLIAQASPCPLAGYPPGGDPPPLTETPSDPASPGEKAKAQTGASAAESIKAEAPPRQGPRPEGPRQANRPPAQPAFPPILTDILERAQALFGPLREAAQVAPQPSSEVPVEAPPEPPYCPFPDFYPDAHWRKVPYPGARRCYLEGRAQSESGRSLLLHGIPGEYSPVPPVPGFKRFLRDRDGCGYWIRIRKM